MNAEPEFATGRELLAWAERNSGTRVRGAPSQALIDAWNKAHPDRPYRSPSGRDHAPLGRTLGETW